MNSGILSSFCSNQRGSLLFKFDPEISISMHGETVLTTESSVICHLASIAIEQTRYKRQGVGWGSQFSGSSPFKALLLRDLI